MRNRLILAGLGALMAGAAIAADITVDLGSVTIPAAAVADIQAWLATQTRYQETTVNAVRRDPETGRPYSTPKRVRTEVVETPQEKLRRIARAAAVRSIRESLRQFRNDRARRQAEQLPDPVTEETP